jgi:hypothetical protein
MFNSGFFYSPGVPASMWANLSSRVVRDKRALTGSPDTAAEKMNELVLKQYYSTSPPDPNYAGGFCNRQANIALNELLSVPARVGPDTP